jgi:phenylalanyl-tRNA synthetase beta chain
VPVIGISVKYLNALLKTSLSPEELTETLGQLGCDADEPADIAIYECPQCRVPSEKLSQEEAPRRCVICGHEAESDFPSIGSDKVVRLDLLPARSDLFDPGGLSRALKGYLEIETGLPHYHVETPEIRVEVSPDLSLPQSYRPFIACAVVTMPPLDGLLLRVLMKLQENLHWGIGRNRKLSSIGVYDLDTITPPIFYGAASPTATTFCPLGLSKPMTAAEILEKHPKGIAYAHLLKPLSAYPLLRDSRGQVLSLPPIINSNETKVRIGTTRLFIDVTGITQSDVDKSLNTFITSLSEMGGHVQAVIVRHQDSEKITPDLEAKEIQIHLDKAHKWLGFDLKASDLVRYLERMRLGAHGRSPVYYVKYPVYRADIKHEVDIFEDIAIAHGFANLPLHMVSTMTVGEERAEEKVSQTARQIMLGMGFDEIVSLTLTTEQNHFTKLRLTPGQEHVMLLNSKLSDYNVVRCHLWTGLMESLNKNRRKAVPQKFFELGNAIIYSGEEKIPREERRLAFCIIGPDTGYAEARAVIDTLLKDLRKSGQYKPLEHPTFIGGRAAELTTSDGYKAYLGELHPEILENFGLGFPVALGELTLAQAI